MCVDKVLIFVWSLLDIELRNPQTPDSHILSYLGTITILQPL